MKKVLLILCSFILASFAVASANATFEAARKCQEAQYDIIPYLLAEEYISICQDDLVRTVEYLDLANEYFLQGKNQSIEKGKYQLNLALTHLSYAANQDRCYYAREYASILNNLSSINNNL